MKIISSILLLFCISIAFGQKNLEKEILKLEVSAYKEYYAKNTRAFINDSIIVNIEISPDTKMYKDLRADVLNTGDLTEIEVNEIFGTEQNNLFDTGAAVSSQNKWTADSFSGFKIKFYDSEKMKKVYFPYLVVSLSKPIFRKDNKYALIISSNENDGGVLTIYKNTGNGWMPYKKVQLYYI